MKKGSLTGGFSAALRPGLASLLIAASFGCGEAESEAKAQALELEEVAAYWAVRGKDREENNYIHPVVRFRIKNTGAREVGYIQAMAVFKREMLPDEPWGNDFLYSISEKPLAPGTRSEILTLRSDTNFVSKDAPERMFQSDKVGKGHGIGVPASRPVELETRPFAGGAQADRGPRPGEVPRAGAGDRARPSRAVSPDPIRRPNP